jgi:hypothetical protein
MKAGATMERAVEAVKILLSAMSMNHDDAAHCNNAYRNVACAAALHHRRGQRDASRELRNRGTNARRHSTARAAIGADGPAQRRAAAA